MQQRKRAASGFWGLGSGNKPVVLILGFLLIFNLEGMAQEPNVNQSQPGNSQTKIGFQDWWKKFGDPELDALISRAITANLEVKMAALRVREARAAQGITGAARYPALNQTDSVQRIRGGLAQGVNRVGANPENPNSRSSLIAPFETNLFQVGFDASWEIDLFGGVRNSVKASQADTLAAEAGQKDVLLTVVAETARTYIAFRGIQQQLEIARKNIASQQDTTHLTEVRYKAGLANEFDVERAQAQLSTFEAVIPQLEGQKAAALHRLGVLLGSNPTALEAELKQVRTIPRLPAEMPTDIPADLVRRRPDVRQAEAEILAAVARVKVAQAERFPKISLFGSIGRQASEVGGFTLGAGNFFAFGPSLRLPIFAGGRIRSNIDLHKARNEESVARFEQTVLLALEESETALDRFSNENERFLRLNRAVQSSQRAVHLANELYVRGLADFLSVLDAQKTQLTLENDLVRSETERAVQAVALFKSLGGGW
ncbi:MAG: efflux transporter outer membrane subunit [Blastocatellia bacterium]|nr:efflux transporter outer membrane subunit [Blastocatellia bacterium]